MNVRDFYTLTKDSWEDVDPFMCGLELEIEDIIDINHLALYEEDIQVEEDNSLRNNGKEFKIPPSTYEDALSLFQFVHRNISTGVEAFTDRTSIHVHVNVRHLSIHKLKQLILTYALVEPLFFELAGDVRRGSIYAVPLTSTYLPTFYKLSLPNLLQKWHKYTALNVLPVIGGNGTNRLGSIEFRHLYGTSSVSVLSEFLTLVKNVFMYVYDKPEEWFLVTELDNPLPIINTLSTRKLKPSILKQLENTIIDVKLSEVS